MLCILANVLRSLLLAFFLAGMASKQKKKGLSGKEGKKPHHLPLPHIAPLPLAQVLQPTAQLKLQQPQHPSPVAYVPPPVAALESSQLLENTFDSLPNFGPPLMHLSHHASESSSPAGPPPHLGAPQSGGSVSPETHRFLNQHAILPPPGTDLWKTLMSVSIEAEDRTATPLFSG